jgi:hypothetical protein
MEFNAHYAPEPIGQGYVAFGSTATGRSMTEDADVIYHDLADVHVSGHGSREDHKLMLSLTRPRFFMPMHGEYRHLILHARTARAMGIPPERIEHLAAQAQAAVDAAAAEILDAGGASIRSSVRYGVSACATLSTSGRRDSAPGRVIRAHSSSTTAVSSTKTASGSSGSSGSCTTRVPRVRSAAS